MNRERLDKILVERSLVATREKAQAFILAGEVFVRQQKITKPSALWEKDVEIEVRSKTVPYVSRGGIKLEKALTEFKIEVENRICLDIGASTGGFTDCLLKKGAELVVALDVGHGQLDHKLGQDKRVVNVEKTNIRYFTGQTLTQILNERFPGENFYPSLITVDVSFIGLAKVLPPVADLLGKGGEIIVLIKPQFEAPRGQAPRGVVKEEKVREEVLEKIKKLGPELKLNFKGLIQSPIKGGKGNIEYFMYFVK